MNKRDDQCGRAVPVQIPGARWGLCPPRDDVKTPSCSARIAGRGGAGSSTAASRCSVARSGRGGVAPRALSAPLARSRDRRRPGAGRCFAGSAAKTTADPPSAGSGPATSSRPCPRAGGANRLRSRPPPDRGAGRPPSPPAGSDRGGTVLGCRHPVMASRRSSGAADGLRRTAPGRSGPCPPRPDVVRRWGCCFCAGARLHARLARLGSDRRGRWRRPGRRRGPPVRGDGSSRTVMGRYGSMRRGIADHCEDGAARGAPVATAVGGARGRCRNLVRRSPVERRFRPISMRN